MTKAEGTKRLPKARAFLLISAISYVNGEITKLALKQAVDYYCECESTLGTP